MAVINIPIGGRAVPIEVPDFAMESTQQAILETSQQMNAAMAQLAGVEAGTSRTNAQLIQAVKQNTEETKRGNIFSRAANSVANRVGGVGGRVSGGARGLIEANSAKSLSESLFNTVGMAKLGIQVGIATDYLSALGSTLAKTTRVGVNFGENFLAIQESAARVGLTLDEFGKITGTMGTSMRALGQNTQSGAERFLNFNSALQDSLEPFGMFGLKSSEMSMMLADELDIKRRIMGADQTRLLDESALSDQIKEQLRLGTIQARLTGEDIQEARKRNLAMRQDAINASYLSEMSADTAEKFGMLGQVLGDVPGGDQVAQAIVSALATGTDPRAFAGELIGTLGLGGFVDRMMQVIPNDNMGLEDFTKEISVARADLTANSIYSGEQLRRMALFGNSDVASTILETRAQRLDIAAEDFEEAVDFMATNANTGATALLGLSNETSKTTAALSAFTSNMISRMMGGEPGERGQDFINIARDFQNILNNEAVKDFMGLGAQFYGETALMPFMRGSQAFLDPANAGDVNATDLAYMSSIPAAALGFQNVAATLQMGAQMKAATDGIGDLNELMGQYFDADMFGGLENLLRLNNGTMEDILKAINDGNTKLGNAFKDAIAKLENNQS